MKIGIIGAGFVGRALTVLAVAKGHDVMLANSRGPRSLHSAAPMLKCQVGTVEEALTFGVMTVLAVPLYAYPDLPHEKFAEKIVVDAGNYHPKRDELIPELEGQKMASSQWLQDMLPKARVVKGFNAILATDLDALVSTGSSSTFRRALPIAGSDREGLDLLAGLHRDFGIEPVETGSLADSWRFETNMPAYCARLDREALLERLAQADRGKPWPYGHWNEA